MRFLLALILAAGIATSVAAGTPAAGPGNRAPVKTPVFVENVPLPGRQGGDTVLNATNIPSLPFDDSGTTTGYVDDYAGTCLYDNGAPDVVYRLVVPAGVTGITVSLCGSSYDTGLYIYNSSLTQIACNDDYCGLQSELDNVPVTAGQTYYVIVDGYSSASGNYVLTAWAFVGPFLSCPPEGVHEGEPDLVDEYVDVYNGGCNTEGHPFQTVTGDAAGTFILCGESGWYHFAGSDYRDTDWFILTMGAGGAIEATIDAFYATYIFELGPQDCDAVGVLQQTTGGPMNPGTLTITGYPEFAPVWFWAGPTVFSDPDGGENEYEYVIWFSGLAPGPIATEPSTWGAVKALYE